MVSYPCLRISHRSINAHPASFRCADVAVPLPHHGRCLSGHIHPIHRTRHHLRPLISWLFLAFPHAFVAPIIDNPEPNFSLRTISDTPCLSRLLRSRFLLTLLEASVIHSSVSIAYCGLHRMVNNSSGSDSVVDFLVLPPPPNPHILTFIGSRSFPLESINHQTQYPPSPLSCTITLPSVFNRLYILTASCVYLIMHRLTLI